jgi:hypothetical protein
LVAASEETLPKEEKTNQTETGIKGFLNLRAQVSSSWTGHPTVLEETRRSRRHEKQ